MLFPLRRSAGLASGVSTRRSRSARRRPQRLSLERLEARELLSGEPLQIILEASQIAGGPALSGALDRSIDDTFFVNIYVRDLRTGTDAQGVSGGKLDLHWSGDAATATSIEYSVDFTDSRTGDRNNGSHLVNEVGATTTDTEVGVSERALLCSIEMTALTAGTLEFSVNEGDGGFSLVGLSDPALASNSLTVTLGNHAPLAADANYTVAQGGSLTTTDVDGTTTTTPSDNGLKAVASDPDHDALTFTVVTPPQNGTLTLDSQTGLFTYTPNTGNTAISDSFTYKVDDGTGTATATVHLAINHAPSFSAASRALSVPEGTTAVATVTATDANGGTLTYTLSGTDAERFEIGTNSGILTFKAAPDFEQPADADTNNAYTLDVTATDADGATAVQHLEVTVTDQNSAPDLTPTYPNLGSIAANQTNNAGKLVSEILGTTVTDADGAGVPEGLAIVATAGSGTWQYSLDNGSTWTAVGTVSYESALLLRANDKVRFVPSSGETGESTFTYVAWDQTGTTAGQQGTKVNVTNRDYTTPFSKDPDTARITVTAATNSAPVLTTTTFTLPALTEDPTTNDGVLVTTLLGSSVTDTDGTTNQGIAVFGVVNTNGAWEYSTDSGSTWTAFGSPLATSARLLAANTATRLRFKPNADYSGTVTAGLSFRAWDQSDGTAGGTANITATGGTSVFSEAAGTGSITVTAVNDAPVIGSTATFTVTGINEDPTNNPGTLISTLLTSGVTDADSTSVSKGIAVYAVNNTNGTWRYTTDGTTWKPFSSSISETSAQLLASDTTTRVRFEPNANYSGTISNGLSFRAWDQTSGSPGGTASLATHGGSSAFSDQTANASLTIAAANDLPTIDNIANPATIAKNAGQQTINLTGIAAGPSESQTLQVTATSSNTTLIPAANLSVTYTSPNSTGTLKYTAATDQVGSSTITVTVRDAGLDGTLNTDDDGISTKTFTVTVGSASLSGNVYVDSNGDGSRASTEYGIGHVVVTLQQLSNGSYVNLQTVTTASDGSYSFTSLPAGTYQIVESQPSNIRDGSAKAGTSGGTVSANKITAITLTEGTAATGYNFAEQGLALKYIALQMCFTFSPTIDAIYTEMVGTNQLTLSGTSSADTITIAAGTDYHTVTINGVQQRIAATVDAIMLDSGDGSDTVTLTGTSLDDVATIATNTAKLTSSKYSIQVTASESITVNGVSGTDSAVLNDTSGNDTLTASTSSIKLAGTSFTAELSAFKTVKAIHTAGTDTVSRASALDYVLTLEGQWTTS